MKILNENSVRVFKELKINNENLSLSEYKKFNMDKLFSNLATSKSILEQFVDYDSMEDPLFNEVMPSINSFVNKHINAVGTINDLINRLDNLTPSQIEQQVNEIINTIQNQIIDPIKSYVGYIAYIKSNNIDLDNVNESQKKYKLEIEEFEKEKEGFEQFNITQRDAVIKMFNDTREELVRIKIEATATIEKEIELIKQKIFDEQQSRLSKEYINFFEMMAEGEENVEFSKQNFFLRLIKFRKYMKDGYKQIYNFWRNVLMLSVFFFLLVIIGTEYIIFTQVILQHSDILKDLGLYLVSIRLTLYSLFGYMIYLINRNYANNRHLYNVYKQKALSLRTYESFMLTMDKDSDIRKDVSLKIAQTIFESVETGYINQQDSSMVENLTNIIKK